MLVYVMGIVCAMFIVEDEKDAFYCLLYLIVGLDTNVKDDVVPWDTRTFMFYVLRIFYG